MPAKPGITTAGTAFTYTGELGTDLWALGASWGDRVAGPWKRTVATSLDAFAAEAERAGTERVDDFELRA